MTRYETRAHWSGSTKDGLRSYSREHTTVVPDAKARLQLSADPTFRGDADLLNPEQLVVMAAASCQMLSFLAVAAREGVDVIEYEDVASASLELGEAPIRLSAITIEAAVKIDGEQLDAATIDSFAERAGRECFIANSLAVPVRLRVTAEFV